MNRPAKINDIRGIRTQLNLEGVYCFLRRVDQMKKIEYSCDLRILLIVLVFAMTLSGCASCGNSRVCLKMNILQEIEAVVNGKKAEIKIGMTKERVKILLGEPEKTWGNDIWMYSTDMGKTEYEKKHTATGSLYQVFFKNELIIKIEQDDMGEYKFGCSTVDL